MNMEIKGYTLHGDYYLSDKVIPNKNWKEACKMKEEITLPNGKTVIARTLSFKELETIPKKERRVEYYCYWTSTLNGDSSAWYVNTFGGLYNEYIDFSGHHFGARLGFKNPFLHSDKKEAGLVYKDREFQKINNKNTIKEEILEIYNKCFNY